MRAMWGELLQHRAQLELFNTQILQLFTQQNELSQRLHKAKAEKATAHDQLAAVKSELSDVVDRLTKPPRILKIKVDKKVKVCANLYRRFCY
jgi:chromosome segregation ATPase